MFVPRVRLFPLVYWFVILTHHRQKWYQKFIGTYPPLISLCVAPSVSTMVRSRHLKMPRDVMRLYLPQYPSGFF